MDPYRTPLHPSLPDSGATPAVAYLLMGATTANHMYSAEDPLWPGCCPNCSGRLEDIPRADYRVFNRFWAFLETEDGYPLCSIEMKRFLEERKPEGLRLEPLPADPRFFLVHSDKILALDYAAMRTEFGAGCSVCGEPQSAFVYTYPLLCTDEAILPKGRFFMRSRYRFSAHEFKSYCFFVDPLTAKEMMQSGFARRVWLTPVCQGLEARRAMYKRQVELQEKEKERKRKNRSLFDKVLDFLFFRGR